MYDLCENCGRTPVLNRRQFLSRLGMGFGGLGLAALLSEEALRAAGGGAACRW
jgi:hypothetical protein